MKKLIIFIVLPVIFYSCQKVVTLKLNNVSSQLGIEGVVSDTAGPYHVLLYKSEGFYADNVYPPVQGAVVIITDTTAGIVDSLTETAPGLYTTHRITGTPGHAYRLTVWAEGNAYTALSTMPQPVLLDSVTFNNQKNNDIRAVANFQDPGGIVNYYKYSATVNGVYLKRFQTFEDRLSDGRYIIDKMDNDTAEIKLGDTVRLSLVGVDKNVYTFLFEAEDVAYSNDNLAAPATPASNITGGALGYFSAQTVHSKTAVVKF